MPMSLAEMRTSKAAALPERVKQICLAQALVAECQTLANERDQLTAERSQVDPEDRDEEGNRRGKPRRVGQGKDPRATEIDERLEAIQARLAVLWDEMREHTGEVRVRAVTGGEWRRWVDQHPARPDSKVDEETAYGFCNADDLLASLETYAVAWNEEPLGEGDWEFITNRAALGDLKALCRIVVQMHEGPGAVAPGKSQSVSSVINPNETA